MCESQGPPPPPRVLVSAPDGGAVCRVLLITLPRIERRNTGGSTVSHHIQFCGGRSGLPLGVLDGKTGGGGQ